MRAHLLAAALLLAPLAAAQAPPVRSCTSNSCVIAQDTDGDGAYDWANVALVAGEQVTVNANLDRGVLLYEVAVTTEELADDAGDAVTVSLTGEADGACGGDALLFVGRGDHETGEQETLLWRHVVLP